MNTKEKGWSTAWKMLFSYLAVSKIIYWYNMVIVMVGQGDFGAAAQAIFWRLLSDIPIVIGVILIFYMENIFNFKISKFNKITNEVISHIFAYMIFTGAIAIYYLILAFAGIQINWIAGLIYTGIAYVIVVVVLDIKRYIRAKKMTTYTPKLTATEKLAILKTLLDNDVLTQEEYDIKKEGLA